MSAHDWPEFDQLMPNGKLLTEREFVGLTRAQYNYAKVRIDGYDALQQRCEELLTDNAKMKQLLLHFLYHHQGASSVIGQPIRILFGMNDHEHMTDDQIAIAKQVQPCNTPTK